MSNLETAKEKLAENQAFTAIISPSAPAKKNKIKIPPEKTIKMIEEVLFKKLESKQKKVGDLRERTAIKKYENELTAIHQKAIALKKEIMQLNEEMKIKENKKFSLADNDGDFTEYFHKLPNNMSEIKDTVFVQFSETIRYHPYDIYNNDDDNWLPELLPFKHKIEKFILSVKIGTQPASDAQILLDEIEKI